MQKSVRTPVFFTCTEIRFSPSDGLRLISVILKCVHTQLALFFLFFQSIKTNIIGNSHTPLQRRASLLNTFQFL